MKNEQTYRAAVNAAMAEIGLAEPYWQDHDDGWWLAFPPGDAPDGYEAALERAVNLASPLWPAR
ncbi:MAG: hypothetical protein GY708_12970 [Actinomycetia bacterium]|nr:hypothetical protein [Actinomycetes bacterium]